MVLFPTSGLGRFLLALLAFTTLAYLVLSLVSFGGIGWVTYLDVPIQFGLWRVCDTSAGLCNQWADSAYSSNITNATFNGGKPSYVQSAQALEIISLIFYIIAAVLIVIGILNVGGLPYEAMFMAAGILLFICIIFISASLGVMSDQGKNNHTNAYLSWAWWNGLIGLILMIITVLVLVGLILDMRMSPTNNASRQTPREKQQNPRFGQSAAPYPTGASSAPPVLTPNNLASQLYNYPNYNQYPQQNYPNPNQYSQQYYPDPNQYSQQNYPNQNSYPQQNYPDSYSQQNYPNPYPQDQQYNSNNYYSDPMLTYGDQSPAEQYFNNQSPSPLITALAQQYVSQVSDANYQNQLLAPYQQYSQNPYMINSYL